MEHLYVDESGSMDCINYDAFKCFVICTVRIKNKEKAKKKYKRFVSRNMDKLRALGKKMFLNGNFKELKGNCFDFDLKNAFADYFLDPDLLEIYYISVDNSRVNSVFYKNTALAFNYLYKYKMHCLLTSGLLPNSEYTIQFDNRNQKNESKTSLNDYLNTELHLGQGLSDEISVVYFDSTNNCLIQIADVFSNIFYSAVNCPERYNELLNKMKESGCLKAIINYPPVLDK